LRMVNFSTPIITPNINVHTPSTLGSETCRTREHKLLSLTAGRRQDGRATDCCKLQTGKGEIVGLCTGY
jgi:hypothetical protein